MWIGFFLFLPILLSELIKSFSLLYAERSESDFPSLMNTMALRSRGQQDINNFISRPINGARYFFFLYIVLFVIESRDRN